MNVYFNLLIASKQHQTFVIYSKDKETTNNDNNQIDNNVYKEDKKKITNSHAMSHTHTHRKTIAKKRRRYLYISLFFRFSTQNKSNLTIDKTRVH